MAQHRPKQALADSGTFSEIRGPTGKRATAQQHDVWIWINGCTPDVVFERARAAWLAIRDFDSLATEQPCFVCRDSRDPTGFADGTRNPEPLDAPSVSLIPRGLPGQGLGAVRPREVDMRGDDVGPISFLTAT